MCDKKTGNSTTPFPSSNAPIPAAATTGILRNMTSIYLSRGEQMLLLYRIGSKVVAPSWCGFGGHFEKDELNDARACVLRELYEEMRIAESDLENLQMRYITLRQKNGEIRQNYYFFADLKPHIEVDLDCGEGRPEWTDYVHILEKEMPHSAYYVLQHYLETGRYTNDLYARTAHESGVAFLPLAEF